MTAPSPDRFTLEAPSDPAYVSAVRLFAATVARQVGVAEENLDDVKVAIGEACARALATAPERPLSVRAERSNLRLAFEVEQGQASPSSPSDLTSTSTPTPQELAVGLNLELITALFDDADVVLRSDGTPMLRFSVEAGS